MYSSSGGFFPRVIPCSRVSSSNPHVTSRIVRLRSWRNKVNGVQISRVAQLVLSDLHVVENVERGIEMPGAQGGLLVGAWGTNRIEHALITGSQIGIETAAWHRMLVSQVTFSGFTAAGTTAVAGFAKEKFTPKGGGWETRFEGVTWHATTRRVRWRHLHENVFVDVDGTFTEQPGTPASLVPHNPLLGSAQAFPECQSDPYAVGLPGLICRGGLRFARVALNNMLPRTALQYVNLLFRQDGSRGAFVRADDTAYLADKWRPVGGRLLVEMDVSVGAPTVASGVGASLWTSATCDEWRGAGQMSVFLFEEIDVNGGARAVVRNGTVSADGSELAWSDAFVPWVRCSARPEECVGPIRYDGSLPTTPVPYGFKRRTHGRGYVALLPVNRLYELEWELTERDRVDVESFSFGIGELRDGEWMAFRTAPAVQMADHFEVRLSGAAAAHVGPWQNASDADALALVHAMATQPSSSSAILQGMPTGSWLLDNISRTGTFVVRDAPPCAAVEDPCIHQIGTFKADPCPASDPGCQLPPSPPPFDGFRYIYSWSDPAAWNGTKPVDGDAVVIPPDRHIMLDEDTPHLGSLTIFGKLECSPTASALRLRSQWILVRGGRFLPGASFPWAHTRPQPARPPQSRACPVHPPPRSTPHQPRAIPSISSIPSSLCRRVGVRREWRALCWHARDRAERRPLLAGAEFPVLQLRLQGASRLWQIAALRPRTLARVDSAKQHR